MNPGPAFNSIFFQFHFCKESLIWKKSKSMTLCQVNTFFPFLLATPLSLSHILEALFELTRHLSRALDLLCALLSELLRIKDTVLCATPGAKVLGHCQKQLTRTWIVRLLKMHFLHSRLFCEQPVFRPDSNCLSFSLYQPQKLFNCPLTEPRVAPKSA